MPSGDRCLLEAQNVIALTFIWWPRRILDQRQKEAGGAFHKSLHQYFNVDKRHSAAITSQKAHLDGACRGGFCWRVWTSNPFPRAVHSQRMLPCLGAQTIASSVINSRSALLCLEM